MRRTISLAAAAALTILAGAAIATASPWTTNDANRELTTGEGAVPLEATANDPAETSPDAPATRTRADGPDEAERDDARAGNAVEHGHGAHEVTSELDFLTQMIPHHEEAVVAAEQLRDGTQRDEMRRFADQIIEVQTDEIRQMQAWLDDWYPDEDHTADYQPMMRDLTELDPDEIDRAFLDDMIPHHMGAVMMARQLLTRDLVVNPDIEPFAAKIADDQRAEIMQMRRWLADWYDASPMGGMFGHDANGSLGAGGMHGHHGSHGDGMGDQPRFRQRREGADGPEPGANTMGGRGGMNDSQPSSGPRG